MRNVFVDRVREHPGVLWVLIPVGVLNLWFDYYHPFGFVVDGIVVIAVYIR